MAPTLSFDESATLNFVSALMLITKQLRKQTYAKGKAENTTDKQ